MRHEPLGTGYELNDFVRQQVRLDRRYTIAFDAFHFVQRFHQIKKSFPCRFAEITDVYSCQDNLLTAFGRRLTSLLHKRGNTSVTTASAGKRNGAIRAVIIATVLHFQEETGTVAARARRSERTDIFQSGGIGLTAFMLFQVTQILKQVFLLLRPQHNVHAFYLCHGIRPLFSHIPLPALFTRPFPRLLPGRYGSGMRQTAAFQPRNLPRESPLPATSVTEQVFTTHISAFSPLRAVRTPASRKILPIVEVSEKFSLHPNV